MKPLTILRTAIFLAAISALGCQTAPEAPSTCAVVGTRIDCSVTLTTCLDDGGGSCSFDATDPATGIAGTLTLSQGSQTPLIRDQNLTWSFGVAEANGQKAAGTWSYYPSVPGTPGNPEGQIVMDGDFTGVELVVYDGIEVSK